MLHRPGAEGRGPHTDIGRRMVSADSLVRSSM
jgi:hypothetical protein